jgi:hypothetical protein
MMDYKLSGRAQNAHDPSRASLSVAGAVQVNMILQKRGWGIERYQKAF